MQLKLKLKEVVGQRDFRSNERTHYMLWEHSGGVLHKDEAVLFISKSENQLLFVFAPSVLSGKDGPLHLVIASAKLRLDNGAWNPMMLQNYAEKVGIELEGIRRFEKHYASLVAGHETV